MTAAVSAAGANHIVSLFRQLALLHGDRPAYEWQLQEQWQQASWGEMMAVVERAASALIHAGHSDTDRVGVMARNMPEWTIADLAILAARGVPVVEAVELVLVHVEVEQPDRRRQRPGFLPEFRTERHLLPPARRSVRAGLPGPQGRRSVLYAG